MDQDQTSKSINKFLLGVAFGLPLGVAIGASLANIVFGLTIGLIIGGAIGLYVFFSFRKTN